MPFIGVKSEFVNPKSKIPKPGPDGSGSQTLANAAMLMPAGLTAENPDGILAGPNEQGDAIANSR